jgi:hypothetical protein
VLPLCPFNGAQQSHTCRCTAAILAALPPALAPAASDALPLLLEKLNIEGTRLHAIRAVGVIARSRAPVNMAPGIADIFAVMQSLLRKDHRALRHETLLAAVAVLEVYGSEVADQSLLDRLLAEASGMVNEADLMLASAALDLCVAALMVRSASTCSTIDQWARDVCLAPPLQVCHALPTSCVTARSRK